MVCMAPRSIFGLGTCIGRSQADLLVIRNGPEGMDPQVSFKCINLCLSGTT